MNTKRIAIAGCAAMVLAACATTGDAEDGAAPGSGPGGQCDDSEVQRFIGQKATGEIGRELLRITGAQQLRWAPPRTAVTMDFRPDRLTVSYDDDMVIERISCG